MQWLHGGRGRSITRPVLYSPSVELGPRIGQGRAAEVFALGDDRVVKVARADAAAALEREAIALRAAHAAGLPVPVPHELLDIDGRRALVMGRVAGSDMLTSFARKPWTLLRAGRKLGRLHARLHEAAAPSGLPSAKTVLERSIADSAHVPEAARDRVLGILRELPDGDRLCHFDFHPGNVIVGSELTVIDWASACRGDPLADVAATLIALGGGKTTPGTPLVTRLFAPIGRKLILGGYRRGYRIADREALARWRIVLAGLRLTYAIEGEQEHLLAITGG